MPRTATNYVEDIWNRAVEVASGGDANPELAGRLREVGEYMDGLQHPLLTFGFIALVLHELHRAADTGSSFNGVHVFVRLGVVLAALAGFPHIVRLILSLFGGSGSFSGYDEILVPLQDALTKRIEHADRLDWHMLVIWGIGFFLISVAALAAFVVTKALALSQGFLILILLAVGKQCLVLTLIPGVGLIRPWARALAMVAAWTMLASVIDGVTLAFYRDNQHFFQVAQFSNLLKIAGAYIVYTVFTWNIPRLTAGIFNGVMAGAPGMGVAVAGALLGARAVRGLGFGTARRAGAAAKQGLDKVRGNKREEANSTRRPPKDSGAPPALPAARSLPRDPAPVGPGGSATRTTEGERNYRGQAARDYAAKRDADDRLPMPEQKPRQVLDEGSPGANRFRDVASDDEHQRWHDHATAPADELPDVPRENRPMSVRAHAHQATLQNAYPGLKFQPKELSREERAIISELDSQPRFAGWTSGAQGRGDFHVARTMAHRRMEAGRQGLARPAPSYSAQAHRQDTALRPSTSSAAGAASAPASRGARAARPAVRPGPAGPRPSELAPATEGAPRGEAAVGDDGLRQRRRLPPPAAVSSGAAQPPPSKGGDQ